MYSRKAVHGIIQKLFLLRAGEGEGGEERNGIPP